LCLCHFSVFDVYVLAGLDVAASSRGEGVEENRNGHHQREEASQQINEGL
jgi:hypothetical protein